MATFGRRHEAALHYIFGQRESAIGFCSSFASQVARLLRVASSRRLEDPLPLEQWACWSHEHEHEKARRAYRALCALDPSHAMFLWRMYGPRCTDVDHKRFGTVAPLVKYTGAFEGGGTGKAFVAACTAEATNLLNGARAAFADAYG